MRIRVKICGITTEATALVAAEAGADALGFVFAESPRRIEASVAAEIAAALPPFVSRVAVFRQMDNPAVAAALDVFPADWVQGEGPARHLPPGLEGRFLPVLRGVAGEVLPRAFVLEGPASGIGARADWDAAAAAAREARLVLAGGLDPDNVEDAILKVRPWAVDVSSGVERTRGVKDPRLIRAFIAAVRRGEAGLREAGERGCA
jgi:phosphoribosylanthranilate isomerase